MFLAFNPHYAKIIYLAFGYESNNSLNFAQKVFYFSFFQNLASLNIDETRIYSPACNFSHLGRVIERFSEFVRFSVRDSFVLK